MAEIERKAKRYPTDLADEEWLRVEPFLPGLSGKGRPLKWQLRDGNAGFIGDLGAVAATQFVEVSCNAENLAENPVEAGTTGQSGTRFDEAEQKFIHVWDTSSTLGGRCADFLLGLNDGSQHRARFAFQ